MLLSDDVKAWQAAKKKSRSRLEVFRHLVSWLEPSGCSKSVKLKLEDVRSARSGLRVARW